MSIHCFIMNRDETPSPKTVSAGELAPWTTGDLPPAPPSGWRSWTLLIGPGVLMAGASIGSGEWLAGPGVTAQYGGTLLWVATLSILAQVFCNLEMMRYTVYCGEPILVGALRTWPGPKLWILFYILLEFGHIWPFNVASAAVPVAAAILGHLPGEGTIRILGISLSEHLLVKILACTLFLAAFIPLIFGGTVYKTLERIMTVKLVLVLGFLVLVTCFLISSTTMRDVMTGFVQIGTVPIRAETVIDGRHFTITQSEGQTDYKLVGTAEGEELVITEFLVQQGTQRRQFGIGDPVPESLLEARDRLITRAKDRVVPERFLVEQREPDGVISVEGHIDPENYQWRLERVIRTKGEESEQWEESESLPDDLDAIVDELVDRRGLRRVQLIGYVREHGSLPDLDWKMIAVFASIAGAGGLTNVLLSNYARDKGWGMGAHVGAISSAVGGTKVSLSHVGKVFPLTEGNRTRWRGWMRHIFRDQIAIWMVCCFIGMALPCMMSIEFIRNAPVSGDRVAAMTAEGMDYRYPGLGLWSLTLIISFLVLYPGQIMSGDTIPRRWCDILWTASSRMHRVKEHQVKYVYYGIMAAYASWGLVALTLVGPLGILKLGGIFMNLALGGSALHTLYVNRTLLPDELKPNWFMQLGLVFCCLFFFGITVIVAITL